MVEAREVAGMAVGTEARTVAETDLEATAATVAMREAQARHKF